MSEFPGDFLAHLRGGATTVCHCWRVTRTDGVLLGFTDHDARLSFGGVDYQPQSGLSASEARQSLGLAADATDVEGALSSDAISEADIEAGRYDRAKVETLLVNWREPAQHAVIRTATAGKIARRDGTFTLELESLASALDRPVGRYFRKTCDAELGDGRCGFDLSAAGFSASGTVAAVAGDAVTADGLAAFEDGWFSHGLLTWASGAMAGRVDRVVSHAAAGAAATLALWQGVPSAIAAGDAFEIVAGCDKRFATCKAKFDNQLNFRGFPHLPGNDAAYAYVVDGLDFDGGTLTP